MLASWSRTTKSGGSGLRRATGNALVRLLGVACAAADAALPPPPELEKS